MIYVTPKCDMTNPNDEKIIASFAGITSGYLVATGTSPY